MSWADSHIEAHYPRKRFSWTGLLALLAVAWYVGWFVWQLVEAF